MKFESLECGSLICIRSCGAGLRGVKMEFLEFCPISVSRGLQLISFVFWSLFWSFFIILSLNLCIRIINRFIIKRVGHGKRGRQLCKQILNQKTPQTAPNPSKTATDTQNSHILHPVELQPLNIRPCRKNPSSNKLLNFLQPWQHLPKSNTN